jgi:hypothetical protein
MAFPRRITNTSPRVFKWTTLLFLFSSVYDYNADNTLASITYTPGTGVAVSISRRTDRSSLFSLRSWSLETRQALLLAGKPRLMLFSAGGVKSRKTAKLLIKSL